jgi:hypothetical protein
MDHSSAKNSDLAGWARLKLSGGCNIDSQGNLSGGGGRLDLEQFLTRSLPGPLPNLQLSKLTSFKSRSCLAPFLIEISHLDACLNPFPNTVLNLQETTPQRSVAPLDLMLIDPMVYHPSAPRSLIANLIAGLFVRGSSNASLNRYSPGLSVEGT